MDRTLTIPVTIPINQATSSEAANVQGYHLVAVSIPSSFTGASISFTGDIDGQGTFQPMHEHVAGALISWVLGGANRIICPTGASPLVGGVCGLKVVSASNEAAERTLVLHFLRTNEE